MQIDFFRGVIYEESGKEEREQVVYWARTPYGIDAVLQGSVETLEHFDPSTAVGSEPIATLDLTGLDTEGAQLIVKAILRGGYLARPGVKDKGDAVLFILVNEALHALENDENA
jgi:hypothetical protein